MLKLSPVAMRSMPRILLLLFCMSMVTMMFIARCGLNMDSQLHSNHQSGLPMSSSGTPGEKALREVMRRKEVEHIRDKSLLQEKIKSLQTQLNKVQNQVVNLTTSLLNAEKRRAMRDSDSNMNQDYNARNDENGRHLNDGAWANGNGRVNNDALANRMYPDYGYANKPNVRFGNNEDSARDRHLAFPNDGLHPVSRIRVQKDRLPVFDEKKPIFYAPNNKYPNAGREGQGMIPNQQQGVYDGQRFNQFQNQRNSGPSNAGLNYRGRGAENDARDMGLVDRHALGLNDNDGSVRKADEFGGAARNFGVVGNGRLERNAFDQGDSSEMRPNSFHQGIDREGIKQDEGILKVVNGSAAADYEKYIHDRIQAAEIVKGQPYKTEYELIPFNRFIYNRIFMVDPGLGKRVVEKPIGSKKKDLNEILYQAVETLNRNRSASNIYTYDDFVEGIYRSDPASGSHYELFFTNRDDKGTKHPKSYVKLSVVKPFAPPITVQQNIVKTASEWINIILPLSKRLDTFRIFMDQFITVCIKHDKRIYLTVVYFGTEGLKEVKTIMGQAAKAHKFKHMKLVTLNETFARGRGLQIGALNWKGGGDVLLFFCDVDIVFTPDFLERCRLNSEQGQRVYYPIVFSLYNPKIVYSLQDVPMPSFQDQLVLSKDTGFWRDFGYGMTCQYRSDFLKIKGFDEQITGWGGEDVFLYQKFVRSDYFVVRATDPAIFHLWHEKYCDPTLSAEQYRSCIRSKALNEASHPQLGLLAFKDEIDVHRSVSERNSILMRNNAADSKDSGQQGENDMQVKKP